MSPFYLFNNFYLASVQTANKKIIQCTSKQTRSKLFCNFFCVGYEFFFFEIAQKLLKCNKRKTHFFATDKPKKGILAGNARVPFVAAATAPPPPTPPPPPPRLLLRLRPAGAGRPRTLLLTLRKSTPPLFCSPGSQRTLDRPTLVGKKNFLPNLCGWTFGWMSQMRLVPKRLEI